MKTIGSIIITLCFAFIMLYGSVLIFNQAASNNVLDLQSEKLISQYDTEYNTFRTNITSNYNTNKGLVDYEVDQNDIGTEAKEFFETKDKINQLKATAKLALNLPDVFFLSIPFVDESDLTLYKVILGLLLMITIFVAFLSALFGNFWRNT